MARRDKTGPNGKGPGTGRGLGNCKVKNRVNNGFGRGRGLMDGSGLGRRSRIRPVRSR